MPSNVICLVLDGWNTTAVGAYGNTWLQTPAIDRLAVESFLFDQLLIDTVELSSLYRAWWTGRGALTDLGPPTATAPLAELVRAAGWNTALICDEPLVADDPRAEPFAERILIPAETRAAPVDEIEQTQLFRLFAAAGEWLASARDPFFLWLHGQAMFGAWDAPLELRRQFMEEDDPEPPQSAEFPNFLLPENFDPDTRTGFRYAYGGQAMVIDMCLQALLSVVDEAGAANRTLVSVCGGRGFPLGEHRRLGLCDGALFEELVHVPWLLRLPDGRGALRRTSNLVQPCDLFATLVEFCGIAGAQSVLRSLDDESWPIRDRVCLFSPDGGQRAIRTPAWYLREPRGGAAELYAKPDDRWEANDVAVRCGPIAEGLSRALEETVAAARAGTLDRLEPLEESLVSGEHG